jgi:hypothetical protein
MITDVVISAVLTLGVEVMCCHSLMHTVSYHRHRFPPDIIQNAVWLYLSACRQIGQMPSSAADVLANPEKTRGLAFLTDQGGGPG